MMGFRRPFLSRYAFEKPACIFCLEQCIALYLILLCYCCHRKACIPLAPQPTVARRPGGPGASEASFGTDLAREKIALALAPMEK